MAFTAATIKGPSTSQMGLVYPINQSMHTASERLGVATAPNLRESFQLNNEKITPTISEIQRLTQHFLSRRKISARGASTVMVLHFRITYLTRKKIPRPYRSAFKKNALKLAHHISSLNLCNMMCIFIVFSCFCFRYFLF